MEVGGIERLLFGRKTLLAITGQVEGVGTEGCFVGTFHNCLIIRSKQLQSHGRPATYVGIAGRLL